jgi:hypothetical protein
MTNEEAKGLGYFVGYMAQFAVLLVFGGIELFHYLKNKWHTKH